MVILGLGSNQGNRPVQLKRAIARLSRGRGAVLRQAKVSRIYESPALIPSGAPSTWDLPFLNCAVAGETSLDPEALLSHVQEIERSLGRGDHERWAPRPIDIDILWWDGHESQGLDLAIPHPEIVNRSFVLEPLRDLIPDAVLGGRTIEAHARLQASSSPAIHSADADFRVSHPALMGILNVTPDSFSDGGRFLDPAAALAQARRLVADGAAILDVGAESTRPDGAPVDPQAEWERLEPVLRGLRNLREELSPRGAVPPFLISIDSRNPQTARAALEAGADILNDVTGLGNPKMLELAASVEVPVVFMHSLTVPVVKGETLPPEADAVDLVTDWAHTRIAETERWGIVRNRLIFDPGIGFGKTVRQNWDLLERVERFHDLGLPILVGHSRKSFLQTVTDRPSSERDPETVEVSRTLIPKGIEILRVHDIAGHRRLLLREDQASPAH